MTKKFKRIIEFGTFSGTSWIPMLVMVGAVLSVLIAFGDSSAQETTTVIDSSTTTTAGSTVPEITSISPLSNEAAEFELTINGADFDDSAVDQIYTQEEELIGQGTVLSRSSTQLVVRENMAEFAPGIYIIKIKNSDGVLSNGKELVIIEPPVTSSTTSSTAETTSINSSSTTTAAVTTTTSAPVTTTSTVQPSTISSSSTTTAAVTTTTSAPATTTSTVQPSTTSSSSTTTAATTITLTLGWSANSEPDIGGYVIYYGFSSRNYTVTKDVGNKTSVTITGLEKDRIYYFALKAYNTSGVYSNYSAEISYPPGSVTTSTIAAGGGGGGGGGGSVGGGGSYRPTTTTTAIPVTTTSTTTTIAQCLKDGDCDDGRFCNGKETCVNGICVSGKNPCEEEQLCREDVNECWETVKLNASFLPATKVRRPVLLPQRCIWLLLISGGKNNFDENSIIDFTDLSGEATGVKINPDRKPFSLGNFIFLPVCIEKDAVVGEVILTIRSEAHTSNTPVEEIIETSFTVE